MVKLCSTRNYTQYLLMIYDGKESEKVYTYTRSESQSASRSVMSDSLWPHGL